MRVAVIGAGIAGMGATLALKESGFDVTLFEGADRLGGHANTRRVSYPHPKGGTRQIDVDTGFIVYNKKTYPNLTAMFEHLGVETEWSDMSLGFSIDGGRIEWAADNLDTIFGQRSNMLRPGYILAVREILRFNKLAKAALSSADHDDSMRLDVRLGDWLDERGFSKKFRRYYLYPMAGAIWSTANDDVAEFPARALFRFYENHDLLIGIGDAVQWRTVTGGSQHYVRKVAEALGSRVRLGAKIEQVTPAADGVRIAVAGQGEERFDRVVIASHSDQALSMYGGHDARTRELLSSVRYTPNRAVLHRDPSLMPKRRKVWSSWNNTVGEGQSTANVTYWMNRLQNIDKDMPLFVSLNPEREPDPELVFAEDHYAHPYFDAGAFSAQAQMDDIQGREGVYFAGAWLGYGFHEDGLRSGLRAAAMLDAVPTWARDLGAPLPMMKVAAE